MTQGPVTWWEYRADWERLWRYFKRAWISSYHDNCFETAKGVAYSALLALFPMLTAMSALLAQANVPAVSRTLTRVLFQVAPPGTQELLQYSLRVAGRRPAGLLVVATLLAMWAASGATVSLIGGFHAAYGVANTRSFFKERLTALVLVLCALIPTILGASMILFGSRTQEWILQGLYLVGIESQIVMVLGAMLRYLAATSCIMLAAALMYYMGPCRPMRFVAVVPGAAFATILLMLATQLFGWYVGNLANYNVLYGSIGAVIALLVWLYVLAVVALAGCEFNVAIEKDESQA